MDLIVAASSSLLSVALPILVMAFLPLCDMATAAVVVTSHETEMDTANILEEQVSVSLLDSKQVVLPLHIRDHFASNGRHVGVKGSEHVNVYAKGERLPPVVHEHAKPLSASTTTSKPRGHRFQNRQAYTVQYHQRHRVLARQVH